jgi:hypothetical protein
VARCVSRPLDDVKLARTTTWTRHQDIRFYLSTYTSTTVKGPTLSRTGAQLKRLALVVQKCPACGSVTASVGSTVVGSWSLKASTTKRKVLLVTAPFSYRTGTVRVKVTSSGKPVHIDGLGIRRT